MKTSQRVIRQNKTNMKPAQRVSNRGIPPEERFWMKVNKKTPSECWEWTAYKDKKYGYGRFGITPKLIVWAHRYSYELANGVIPEGAFILHSCDNPKCVNPNHLRAGTHRDNMNDAVSRNRMSATSTIKPEDVVTIREERSKGVKQSVLAKRFGLSRPQISGICTGKYWPHLGGPLTRRSVKNVAN